MLVFQLLMCAFGTCFGSLVVIRGRITRDGYEVGWMTAVLKSLAFTLVAACIGYAAHLLGWA